jgi:hypothetical protein
VFTISYALCVSSQAPPLACSVFLLAIYYALCFSSYALPLHSGLFVMAIFSTPCLLPGTTITLRSICSLFPMPCVSPARHYRYPVVYLRSLFPMPCVSPPRHYHYPAVYFCSLFTVFLPRHYQYTVVYLWSLFPMPHVSPPRYYHYPAVYFCSLFTMPPVCFFLGTTTTLRSVCDHYFLCAMCLPDTAITL